MDYGTQAAWDAVISSWEKHHNTNPMVLQTEHNFNVLKELLQQTMRSNIAPSVDNWRAIVVSNKHRLQVQEQAAQAAPTLPAPVDPRTTIPHQDKFVGIDTIERTVRYVKTVKIPTTHTVAFNELLAYLKHHDIRGGSDFAIPEGAILVSDTSKKDAGAIRGITRSEAKPDHSNDMSDLGKGDVIRGRSNTGLANGDGDDRSQYGLAVRLLDALSIKDVGSIGMHNSGGAASVLQRFKNRMVIEVSAKRAKQQSGQAILDFVRSEISKLRSSSIR